MKIRNWIVASMIAGAWLSDVCAADSVSAQKEAVAAFPDLQKKGSPLNAKFLEIYQREKEANGSILSTADWPMVVARRAQRALDLGIELLPTKLYCPTWAPPDLVFNDKRTDKQIEEDWQRAHSHSVTVPAHIFTEEEGKRVFKEGEVVSKGVISALAKIGKVHREGDLDGLRTTLMPEDQKAFDVAAGKPGAKEGISAYLRQAAPVQILLLMESDEMLVVIVRGVNGRVFWMPLISSGTDYLTTDIDNLKLSRDKINFYGDFVMFLSKRQTADDLVAK